MNIHPAVGFGAVIAGTAILGPIGAVLALPMTAIIQSFAGSYVHRHELIEEADELDEQPVRGRRPRRSAAECRARLSAADSQR